MITNFWRHALNLVATYPKNKHHDSKMLKHLIPPMLYGAGGTLA